MIIQQLLNDGVCFAVVQSNSFLTKAKIMLNQEFEIITSEENNKDLKRRFTKNAGAYIPENQKNPNGIMSYRLDMNELREFRSLKEQYFTKVIDSENGMVWEVTGNSFKTYLKSRKRGGLRTLS